MDKFVIKFEAKDYEHCIIKEELIISDNDDVDGDSLYQKSIKSIISNFNDESKTTNHKNSKRTLKKHARSKINLKAVEALQSYTDSLAKKFSKSYCSNCNQKTTVIRGKARCKKCRTLFSYTCETCNTSYRCFTDLGYHLQRKHSEFPTTHVCDMCASTFAYRKGLLEHKRVYHNKINPGLPCNKCGKTFKTYHKVQHERECGKDPFLKCKKCPFMAKNKGNLACHVKDKHLEFCSKCEKCTKSFTNRRALMRHIRVYCNKVKALECDHCGNKFYRKDEIIKHLKHNHLDDMGSSRICKYCGYTLNQYEYMRLHLKTCQSAPLEFRIKSETANQPDLATALANLGKSHCFNCEMIKPIIYYRTRHCNICKILLKFVCESCPKTFCELNILREHLRVNHVANVWFYECNKCNKSFSRKKNLTRHQNICHKNMCHSLKSSATSNDYYAECSKCGIVYRNEQSSQRHRKTCGREPKFHCDKCNYKTFFKHSMVMHFKAKRGNCFLEGILNEDGQN